jgi:hypothetical protein
MSDILMVMHRNKGYSNNVTVRCIELETCEFCLELLVINTRIVALQVYCCGRSSVLNTGRGSYGCLEAVCVEFSSKTLCICGHVLGFLKEWKLY